MRDFFRRLAGRAAGRYRKMSIQMVISLSFTAVAVVGMLFMGGSLYLWMSGTASAMVEESSQKVLAQVNLNLDSYLRRMMRVSDAMYYRVIKNTDLATGSLQQGMDLLYEENRDALVSIALFDGQGRLVQATPLGTLKEDCRPAEKGWYQAALNKMENFHFSAPHVQNLFGDPTYSYPWVVSLSRYVQLTRDGVTESGVLLVDMSFAGIEQVCRSAELPNGGYVYLIDGDGELIYHPRQQLIYAGLLKENTQAAGNEDTGGGEEQGEAEAAAQEGKPLMAGIAGYGVIRDGKLCKYLEPELSVAVGLMTGGVPISFIAVEDMDGRPCSLEVYEGSAQLNPVWAGPGELKGLELQVEVTASVMESGPSQSSGTEEYINYLTGQLESAVSDQLNSLLQSSMQLKADFLGLAGKVERSSPENFRLMEQDFTEVLPSLELQISVSGRLSHTNDMKEA